MEKSNIFPGSLSIICGNHIEKSRWDNGKFWRKKSEK
jgi:hypothetical protein